MSFHLSGLFAQLSGIGQTQTDAVQSNTSEPVAQQFVDAARGDSYSGLQMLKEMLTGDTFSGKVMGIQENDILLQLANGKSITAHLSEGAVVQAGQTLTFMVEENNQSSISIKPLPADEQQLVLIDKALDAAQYPATEANMNIVRELLGMNMPLNHETIGAMIRNTMKFPNADLNTLANLTRLDIPVTQENITQFEAYKNYEHSITNELKHLGDEFAEIFTNTAESGKLTEQGAMLHEMVDIFYGSAAEAAGAGASQPLETVLEKDTVSELIRVLETAKEPQNTMETEKDTSNTALAEGLKAGTVTVKEWMSQMTGMLKSNPQLAEKLKTVLKPEDFTGLVRQMIDETLKLTPPDVAKGGGINEYYKRVRGILEKAQAAAEKSEETQGLMKDMQSIKSNIDFMNDLNKNMTYFQMPIRFSESSANGELYVFTNKKALAAGSDNISAMLHLDMDNLGPVDVFVKLAGKNVSTNFCLESEEMLDFVYANIDKLNARLEALGYATKFEMKVLEETKKFDFVEDFIEKDTGAKSAMQYIFDIKA